MFKSVVTFGVRMHAAAVLTLAGMVLVTPGTAHAILAVTSKPAPASPSLPTSHPGAGPGRAAGGRMDGSSGPTPSLSRPAASGPTRPADVRGGVPRATLGLLSLIACLAIVGAARRGRRRGRPSGVAGREERDPEIGRIVLR
jgi:hypothetical protein